jgi:chain length determinant protein EpsF
MTPSRFLAAVRSRRHIVAASVAACVSLGIAGALLLPPRYTATAAVVVVANKSSDPMSGASLPGVMVSNVVATQMDVVQSERVLLKAVRSLHLTPQDRWGRAWRGETREMMPFDVWLAERLGRKVDVKPSRDSSMFTISFTADDRDFAPRFTNALVQAYIDTGIEMRLEPARRYTAYFDKRAEDLRSALQTAKSRLSDFQSNNGLVATDEKINLEVARLTDLTNQMATLQTAAVEAANRAREAALHPERAQEVLSDRVVGALSEDLARQEARLKELTERLGDANPQVQQARSLAAEQRARLNAAISHAAGSLESNAKAMQGQQAEMERQLAVQRALVLDLQAKRDAASVLQRDVENAQKAYDEVVGRAAQAALQSGDTQPDVSVVKTASAQPDSLLKRLVLLGVAGLLAGSVLGVVGALVREALDRRVRTDDDILGLGRPLLVSVPRIALSAPTDLSSLPPLAPRKS